MQEHSFVWILDINTDYEGEEHLGVYASKQGAVNAAVKYIHKEHSYARLIPQSDDDEAVIWRFSDTFTVSARRREVKP